jgi:hypothetical protein
MRTEPNYTPTNYRKSDPVLGRSFFLASGTYPIQTSQFGVVLEDHEDKAQPLWPTIFLRGVSLKTFKMQRSFSNVVELKMRIKHRGQK